MATTKELAWRPLPPKKPDPFTTEEIWGAGAFVDMAQTMDDPNGWFMAHSTAAQRADLFSVAFDLLPRALDLYQWTFPGQDVCLDEHGKSVGYYVLWTDDGVETICVFCRHPIASNHSPPGGGRAVIRDVHSLVNASNNHSLTCACMLIIGLLKPACGAPIRKRVVVQRMPEGIPR